jgi:glycosyltransferase involved in cell wall biosynthesis
MKGHKLLFLATEDWFFRSHFVPILRRAVAEGFDVAVAARDSGALSEDVLQGARFVPLPSARGSLRFGDVWRDVVSVRALLRRERPDLVHCIALKPIMLALIAGLGSARAVLAVTGRGFLAAQPAMWTILLSGVQAHVIRAAVAQGRAVLAVENAADRAWVEARQPLPDARVVLMPGAGVDVGAMQPSPETPAPPIVIGVAARLVWSKGVDVAVQATRMLRERGMDVELHVAGEPDKENPKAILEHMMANWRATPGVRLIGRVEDIAAFWARAHIACAPSRGGEGLPRALLEAAACGKPLVTTMTPGCRDFVQDGVTGLLAAPNDAGSLAAMLQMLVQDGALRARMGAAARARVVRGYTLNHAADMAAQAWRRALSAPPAP